jgi:LPS export ABC transporter protein LptC
MAGWIGVLLLVGSCSIDYGDTGATPPDQVPQMVFTDLNQVGVKDGRVLYTVESGQSEVYQSKKQMRLKNFRFQEYDSTGTAVSTGEAEAAVVDTSTNDATLTGKLKAHSSERGVSLEIDGGAAGALQWANEDRVLRSGPGATVRLTKEDGSRVDAQGLVLDLNANRLELEEGVQGTWSTETPHADTNPLPPPVSPPHP